MPKTVTMVPVNVASESQRRVGIAVWRYQPDYKRVKSEEQSEFMALDGLVSFMAMNGFPQRIPQDQLGRLIILLAQAGFTVEFQPMPSREKA